LSAALELLGYRVTGPNHQNDPDIETKILSIAYDLIEQHDAFQDNPWPIIYKQLDEKYPGSKFILTLRDPESWINSQVKHFGRRNTPMRKWIYGVGHPKGHEALYLERYNTHNIEVQDYFKYRPEDLLVIELAKGDGWEKLCPFLEKDIPDVAFPHANRAADRAKTRTPAKRLARKLKKLRRFIRKHFSAH
jgi:hypothetical protein